jgi:DNA invertase Pin-like site-specific DNA recombinase/predicted RNA-binding Zn-ribbon protein involved in translation (DUF1610 family)
MIKDIREHKINCVIVTDLSKLSLSAEEEDYYINDFFVSYEIRFISLESPSLDSYKHPEQMDVILKQNKNAYNDEHSRQTSIKIRSAFHKKRKMGQFIGAFAPYGYMKDPEDKNHLVIDENSALVVQDIFKWFAVDNMSKNAIALKLNELGILSPAAYKRKSGLEYTVHGNKFVAMWGPKTVRDILKNKVYLGHMVQGRYRINSYKDHTQFSTPEDEWYIVENTHVPIISQEIFDLAQKRNINEKKTSVGKNVHIFAGVLKCPDCGHMMVRIAGGSHKKSFFQCRTYREKSKDICTKHMIQTESLEADVLKSIKNQINLAQSLKAVIESINSTSKIPNECRRLNSMLNVLEMEFKNISSDIVSLYMDCQNGILSKNEYHKLKSECDDKIKSLELTIESLRKERQTVMDGLNSAISYLNIFLKYENIIYLNRDIVLDLIDTVYVYENGKVEVVFAYSDQHSLFLDFINRFL